MPITDWPVSERPREKLLQAGAATLSDAELLAVFLRVGAAGKTALDLSRELIGSFGSLTQLFAADPARLAAFKGMGQAKFAQLQVVPELARRALAESLRAPRPLGTSRAVRDYLRLTLSQLPHETFHCLYLDTHHRLIASEELFRGSLRQTRVYPREVARQALFHNAAGVIVAHNHPGGAAAPSRSDVTTTRRLAHALGTLDIDLLDHCIVAGNAVYSFAEHDLMPGPDVPPSARHHTP